MRAGSARRGCPSCLEGLVITARGRYEFAGPCPCCGQSRASVSHDPGSTGIPPKFKGSTWETWIHQEALRGPVSALIQWTGDPWAITLSAAGGRNIGSGKTHALCATATAWRAAGRVTYYAAARTLVEREERIAARVEDPEAFGFRAAMSFPGLLCLDDVGVERGRRRGRWADSVDRVIDARYSSGAPTLVASDLTPAALARLYPRSHSRLSEGLVLPWTAEDFRQRLGDQARRAAAGGTHE